MELEKTVIHIGLEKPVRLLHVTDTHLTLADERDNERKQKLGRDRTASFHNTNGRVERFLDEQITYAEEHCDLMVHTGDLIDFVSKANVEKALSAIPGVTAEVDLEAGTAAVTCPETLPDETLSAAVTEAGYTPLSVKAG